MKQLIHICLPQIKDKIIFKKHIKVALFVGTALNLINQFESIIHFNIDISKAIITYCVPFLVSVYSAAKFSSK